MPLHRSRIKFQRVEYIESSGIDDDGSGVITWSREGHRPQVMDYFDETKLPESLEEAKERIKGFLSDNNPS